MRQHDEADAEDDRVDVEVAAETAGDAAEDAVGRGAREPARRGAAAAAGGGGRRVLLRGLRTGLERVAGGHGLPGSSGCSGGVGASDIGAILWEG